ncbi:MAG: hypothetical protein M3Z29_00350 [Pseudomonadota bacterium]|nr:hypothetical protein [Pseudomonadota bacterium]
MTIGAGADGAPLRVKGSGRVAARAAADRVRASLPSDDAAGGTGVPSGTPLVVLGEPVSTPAGIRVVSDVLGLFRGGAFSGPFCAAAGSDAKAIEASSDAPIAPRHSTRTTEGEGVTAVSLE